MNLFDGRFDAAVAYLHAEDVGNAHDAEIREAAGVTAVAFIVDLTVWFTFVHARDP